MIWQLAAFFWASWLYSRALQLLGIRRFSESTLIAVLCSQNSFELLTATLTKGTQCAKQCMKPRSCLWNEHVSRCTLVLLFALSAQRSVMFRTWCYDKNGTMPRISGQALRKALLPVRKTKSNEKKLSDAYFLRTVIPLHLLVHTLHSVPPLAS